MQIGATGCIWIDGWKEKLAHRLCSFRSFLDAHDKFVVVEGSGKKFSVACAGTGVPAGSDFLASCRKTLGDLDEMELALRDILPVDSPPRARLSQLRSGLALVVARSSGVKVRPLAVAPPFAAESI